MEKPVKSHVQVFFYDRRIMSKNQGVYTALKSAVIIGKQRIIGRSSPGVKLT